MIYRDISKSFDRESSNKWYAYFLLAALFLALGTAISACNTVEGAGQDIEEAGETISDTADDAAD